MPLDSWNEIDSFTLDGEEYYCAFLDILGYKKKSDKFFNNSFNLHGRYERALTATMMMLDMTSELGFVNSSLLEVNFFSDSVIVTHPKNKQSTDALYNVLVFCRVLATQLSFEDLFIRGGISQGMHIEKNNTDHNFSFLSSKALEKAYTLESEKAIYPRILIDEQIVPDITGYNLTLVIKDNEYHILHFAPQLINVEGVNQKEVKLELEDIFKIYSTESDDRIKAKYHWLLCYYYWTLTTTKNIDIKQFEKYKVGDISRFELINQF